MLRPNIKPRTVHKDRYGRNDSLDSLIRVNGRDLLDTTTANQSETLAIVAAEEREREASRERQAILAEVRARVAEERARADAMDEADTQAEWALALVEGETMKQYAHKGFLGLVEQRRIRRTGTLVSVYNSEQAGIDTGEDKWAAVCEDHGSILAQPTLLDARRFASHAHDWCDDCREQYDGAVA